MEGADMIRAIMAKLVLNLLIIITSPIIWKEAKQPLGCLGFQFEFDTFNSNTPKINFTNDAYIDPKLHGVSLTTDSQNVSNLKFSVGRMFYQDMVPLWTSQDHHHNNNNSSAVSLASFNTSFRFQIQNHSALDSGDGMAFLMSGSTSPATMAGGTLGILNLVPNGDPSNHIVAVEFDTFQNLQFGDIDDNHVGIDVNSLNSTRADSLHRISIDLRFGMQLMAWVDYDGDSKNLSVYIALETNPKPAKSFLSHSIDLSQYLPPNIYVGFSAATGSSYELHQIFSWQFNSTDLLPTTVGPAPAPVHAPASLPYTFPTPRIPIGIRKRSHRGVICGIVFAAILILLLPFFFWFILRYRKNPEVKMRRKYKLGDAELAECAGPKRFNYREIMTATKNFSEDNYLGCGGFGPVYRGVLPKTGTLVAVKCIGQNSKQGEREFMAEVKIISRIRHRNLVQLQGWCHDKGQLFLVYDLMTNGSLDQHLFRKQKKKKYNKEESIVTQDEDDNKNQENPTLDWNQRHKIICGLAAGLLYLHEEWEMQVIHRDVKSANVMLDQDFNARLGDFGMARLVDHDMVLDTTMAAGTLGYVAPEVAEIGKATSASDVYSFGTVALEVVCGRSALNYNAPPTQIRLVEWVWDLYSKGLVLQAVDPHLGDDFEREQMERVLCLGLACSNPFPWSRPTMRQVHDCLLNGTPTPPIPTLKPTIVSSHSLFQPCPTITFSSTSTCITNSTSMPSSSSSSSITTLGMPK